MLLPLGSPNLQVDFAQLAYLQFQVEEELEYQARIVKARDYYEGQFQQEIFDELEKSLVGEDLDDAFTGLNINRSVVESLTNRLTVSGIQVQPVEAEALIVDSWFERNKFQALQDEVHTYAVRDGEAFILIEPVEDQLLDGGIDIRWHVHERYTDPTVGGSGEGCRAHYDNHDKLIFVSKRWIETVYDTAGQSETRSRMTLYFANRIEKYVLGDSGVFEQFQDEEDGGWPIAWGTDTEPLGVAAVHFKRRELRPYAKDSWGMQIASDHNLSNLMSTASMSGFPLLWSTGAWPTIDGQEPDSTGDNHWKLSPRSIFGTMNRDARIGRVDSGDLSQLLAYQSQILLMTAAVTATPQLAAMILRANVSGEALKQFDIDQLAKARKMIQDFTPGWAELATISIKVYNYFSSNTLRTEEEDQRVSVKVIWESPEVRDRTERTQEVTAKDAAGVPWKYLMIEWGYGPDDIIDAERERTRGEVIAMLQARGQLGDQAALQALSDLYYSLQFDESADSDDAWARATQALGGIGDQETKQSAGPESEGNSGERGNTSSGTSTGQGKGPEEQGPARPASTSQGAPEVGS